MIKSRSRTNVCIQGLGFVGAAMAVAVANAKSSDGIPIFNVIGVDQDTEEGRQRVSMFTQGMFPFKTIDQNLIDTFNDCHSRGNLHATTDPEVYREAAIVVIDIPLDASMSDGVPTFDTEHLEQSFRCVVERVPSEALILVETTVPPGTCEKILKPILLEQLSERGLASNSVHLAHSYERVMPGENYLKSVTNFWRVYAGTTAKAGDVCEEFLSSVIDVEQFPLRRLSSTTASETAKLLENTYRAVNIALIDEWTKFSDSIGIDLFEVLAAIRVRPTHSNIRAPGIGVGGYCLTKDPVFAPAAARQIFNLPELDFPFAMLSMKVNREMPLHTFDTLTKLLQGKLSKKRVLLLGVSYRPGVDDTRSSPVETLFRKLNQAGSEIECFDPLVSTWKELNLSLSEDMPAAASFDAVVFTTGHEQFRSLNVIDWLNGCRPVVLDAVDVISREHRNACKDAGILVECIGRVEQSSESPHAHL